MKQGIAQSLRHRGRPGIKFLSIPGVTGDQLLGYPAPAQRPPLVVIALQPDLNEVGKTVVAGDVRRRQIAVIVEDGLLGGAYTVGLQRHLSIDLLSSVLKGRLRFAMEVLVNIAILTFAYIMVFRGGIDRVDRVLSRGQVSAVMRLPMGYVYLALPISGVFMIYYSALFIIDSAIKCIRLPINDSEEESR